MPKHFHQKFHRIVNNIIVPYVCTYDIILNKDGSQVEPDLLPVSEIYLGPTNNQDIVLESIKSFIGDLGYAESIVKSSQIPYRG